MSAAVAAMVSDRAENLVHQLQAPGRVNDGCWFVGALIQVYLPTKLHIYQLYDGRVLGMNEIADGGRYAPIKLFPSREAALRWVRRLDDAAWDWLLKLTPAS